MKILVFLAAWRRPEITEICFMGINRLRKVCPIETLCVISEESMKPLCKKYNIDYVFYKNLPLGEKKNFGLTEAFKKSWDYLVEIGSDDVLKDEVLERYSDSDAQLMSITNFCYVNSEDGMCRQINSDTSYGIGRAIRRDVLERIAKGVIIEAQDDLMCPGRTVAKGGKGFFTLNDARQMEKVGQAKIISEECYKVWNDNLSRGLDNNSNFFLHMNGVKENKLKFSNPVAIDIKSKENIWPFEKDNGLPYDMDLALEGLSDEEKTAIKCLSKKAS